MYYDLCTAYFFCCSVTKLCPTLCDPMDLSTPGFPVLQHAPRICPSSCPLNQWCHPTISSSVAFFFCLQSFPVSRSFPVYQLFASCSQSIGASASDLPKSIQDWLPLRLTDLIFLLSKGFSRVLQHHSLKVSILRCSGFFMIWLSHPYRTIGKTIALTRWTFVGKVMSAFG